MTDATAPNTAPPGGHRRAFFARTADRLGLASWERNVADKLDVLQQMYNILVQRVTTARAETLEMTIIILIAVEIVLFLAGWG